MVSVGLPLLLVKISVNVEYVSVVLPSKPSKSVVVKVDAEAELGDNEEDAKELSKELLVDNEVLELVFEASVNDVGTILGTPT